jgi:ABC-type Na+ efflux pump permease subunit
MKIVKLVPAGIFGILLLSAIAIFIYLAVQKNKDYQRTANHQFKTESTILATVAGLSGLLFFGLVCQEYKYYKKL